MKATLITQVVLVGLFFSICVIGGDVDNKTHIYKERAVLSSGDMRAICQATIKLRELRPDWKDYQISVIETDSTIEVTFWQVESEGVVDFVLPEGHGQAESTIGSMSIAHDGLVVELEKKTLRVIAVSTIK